MSYSMKDLVKALTIFEKYQTEGVTPLRVGNETIFIRNVVILSEEDVSMLDDLGFWWDDDHEAYASQAYC